MNDHNDVEDRVADWLEEESRGELPDWVLAATFHQTRREPQRHSLRDRLAALRPTTRRHTEPWAPGGLDMFSATRIVVAAVLIAIVGVGLAFGIARDPEPAPVVPASEQTPAITPTTLLELTLEGDVIPEEFVGVLFSRKTYPTDNEITYNEGFLPPNTFIRHVESGELGIRPVSDTQVVRAGSTWADAEVVLSGDEALIGPGDTFVQQDVPWEEHGIEALGEMWTPGEDAVIVSLAIRERERCCSMSHRGMVSRWYHTLTNGVQELSDGPIEFRVLRWDVPVGDSLTLMSPTVPGLWAVDAGSVTARTSADAADPDADEPTPVVANSPLWAMSLLPGVEMTVENIGEEPAVLYQLLVESAGVGGSAAVAAPIEVVEVARMNKGRSGHEATLLADGRVLLSGGGWADTEVFDPASDSFELSGKMARIRSAKATLLEDGRVLFTGGGTTDVEVYDPATATVAPVAPMQDERRLSTATVLPDGRVLVAGGGTDSAELYDPVSDTFSPTGPMLHGREEHVATPLLDGRILITGGGPSKAELYDPTSGTFSPSAATFKGREGHTATLLDDGRVLLTGDSAEAEIYDPATDTTAGVGPLAIPRFHHAAALLDDGRVLLAGGLDERVHDPIASIEVFDPATNTFSEAGALTVARWYPSAIPLADGSILVTGGTTGTSAARTAELVRLAE